jgi:hypothetical protein
MSAPEISKVLELSTAHLPEEVMQGIGFIGWPRILVDEYGAFVWVPPEGETIDELNCELNPDLARVIKFAQKLGCRWINFDRDNPFCYVLPTWDW